VNGALLADVSNHLIVNAFFRCSIERFLGADVNSAFSSENASAVTPEGKGVYHRRLVVTARRKPMTTRLFQFHFAGTSEIELIETCFVTALFDHPRRSVRGKTPGALRDAGTFQWTSGVRALCILFLKGLVSKLSPEEESVLSGMHGSLAASLDYALSRQPSWLTEMFGTDSQGKCMALRLMNRTNSERKRPGPVAIGLKPVVIFDSQIEVFLNGNRVVSLTDLKEVLVQLGGTEEFATVNDDAGAIAA